MAVTALRRARAKSKALHIKKDLSSDLLWERPSDWPALPDVAVGDQKIVGSVKIENHGGNYVSMQVNVSASTWRIDWGDGTVDAANAGNATVHHQYDYASFGGAVTSEGFKVAIVTITANAGNITLINLNQKPSGLGTNSSWSTKWLELRMATPNISGSIANMNIGGSATVLHRNLRSFEYIGTHGLASNATSMFSGLTALENFKVPKSFTSGFTTMANFFSTCLSLKYCPDLDTAASGSFASMFSGCTALKRVPALDTSLGTVFQFMFQNCAVLEEVPLLDTHLGSTFASMFTGCAKLRTVPLFNLGAGLTLSSMFAGCSSLNRIPTFDTHSATAVNLMFSGCQVLEVIPALDFSAVSSGTNAANVFNLCVSMVKNLSFGMKFTHVLPGQMTAADLDVYYTNLGTASAQTLTVTGNQGVAADTPTIATAKGWTVTGT